MGYFEKLTLKENLMWKILGKIVLLFIPTFGHTASDVWVLTTYKLELDTFSSFYLG